MTIITHKVKINAPIEKSYQFWEDLEALPSLIECVTGINRISQNIVKWEIKSPAGLKYEFITKIKGRISNKYIQWESMHTGCNDEEHLFNIEGEIYFFSSGENHTLLNFIIKYFEPAENLTNGASGIPAYTDRIENYLARIKSSIEVGSI